MVAPFRRVTSSALDSSTTTPGLVADPPGIVEKARAGSLVGGEWSSVQGTGAHLGGGRGRGRTGRRPDGGAPLRARERSRPQQRASERSGGGEGSKTTRG